jgi:hypothetical protein
MIASASAQPTLPTGTVAYVNLTLNESWSSVVSPYVQQNVTINESNYTSYINYNGSIANFEFTFTNGTVVPAWIESNTSGVLTTWLNISNTTTQVQLDIFSNTTNTLSSSGTAGIGEAPQLSGTYGKYDDGASVFAIYFNGNTPTSQFSVGSGISLVSSTALFNSQTVNVLNYSTSSSTTYVGLVYTSTSLSSGNYIAEALFSSNGGGAAFGVVGLGNTNSAGYTSAGQSAIDTETQYSSAYVDGFSVNSGVRTGGVDQQGTVNTNWRYASMTYISSASNFSGYIAPQFYSTSGGYAITDAVNPISGDSPLYFISGSDGAGPPTYINYIYARIRAYPPNGVMPSVSFGAVQQTYTPPTVSVSPTSTTLDIPQNITLTATVSNGTSPYTYQWYNDTSDTPSAISGANTSNLTITAVSTGTFEYFVSVTDAHPTTVNSTNATIIVNSALLANPITPSSPAIDNGQTITLTANPSGGTTPYSYEWFYGSSSTTCNTSISNSNSSTISVNPISSTYYCYTVNDSATTPETNTSASNLITVNPALTATISPASTSTYTYLTTTLTATASGGTSPYSYQWYNDTSGTPQAISGATSSTYSVAFASAGTYVFLANVGDSSQGTPTASVNTSNATINVSLAFTQLTIAPLNQTTVYPNPPIFYANATDMANDTITLNITINGVSYFDGSILNSTNTTINASNSSFTIGNLGAGTYTAIFNASDALGAYILNQTNFTISPTTLNLSLTLPANLTYNNQQQTIFANVSNILIPQNQSLIFSLYGNSLNLTSYGYGAITYPQSNEQATSSFIQSNSNLGLGVGTYTYTFNTTGNQNYTAESITKSFTISPATPVLNITLPSNFTYDGVGGTVNYSIRTINNQSTAYLSYNFTDNSNNSFTYTNVSSTTNNTTYISIPTSGIFNFSVFAPATTNYTSATLSDNLFQITQAQGNIQLFLNGTNGNYTIYQHQTIPINATTTENTTSDNITIELNSTPIISISNSQNISISQQPNTTALYNYTAIITNNNYTTTSQSFTLNTTTPFYNFTLIPTYQYLLPNSTLNGTAPQIFNLLNYTYYLNGSSYWNITNITITFANSTTILNGSGNTINQTIYNLFTNNSITNNTVTISEVDAFNDTLNSTQYIASTPYIFPQITVPVISTDNFINYTYVNITTTIQVTQSGGSFPLSGLTMYFGDGTNATTTSANLTSSQISIPHIYTTTGNMTLEANISDINGFSVVNSTQIQVLNYTAPNVIMNTQQGYIHNQSYVFTAYSGSFGLNYATVLWGDGTQSSYTFGGATGKQIFYFYHTYTIPETYIVKVQIYDTQGVETTYDFSLPIYSFNLPAVTSVLPNEPYNGANSVTETYDFSVQQGSYPIKNITILWNDGYGDVPSGVNILNITGGFGIAHTFPYLDNFTITTIICDSLGDCNTQNWGIVLGFPLQNATTQDLANNFTESQLYIQELQNKSAFVQNPSSIIYLVVFFAGIGTLIMALIVRAKRKQKRISF